MRLLSSQLQVYSIIDMTVYFLVYVDFQDFLIYRFYLSYVVMSKMKVPSPEKRKELENRLIREHHTVEKTLMEYIKIVHQEYSKNPSKYKKYINDVFENIKDRLIPHFEFEEKELFPLLEERQLVEELLKEHKEFIEIIEKAKRERNMEKKIQILEELVKLLKSHGDKENTKILPLLAHH